MLLALKVFIILFLFPSVMKSKPTAQIVDSTFILQRNFDSAAALEANISYAKDILKKYINAIGGESKIRSVQDRIIDMKGIIQGIEAEILFYQKFPNKLCQKIIVGEAEQKIIYDGIKGVKIIGSEKQEIAGDELIKLNFDAAMNLILDLDEYNIKIKYAGSEKVNGKDAFRISLTLPNNSEWLQYYDMESGLKLRDSKDIITPNGKYQQVTEFDNYREIDGMLYPFKIKQYIGNQMLDFTIESIQVNTGVADELFQIE